MTLPPTWDLFGEDHLPHHVLLLAKMLEILRMSPSEALSLDGPALVVESASVRACNGKPAAEPTRDGAPLQFSFDKEILTALILPLPAAEACVKATKEYIDRCLPLLR